MRRGGGWGPRSYAQVADKGGGGWRGRSGGGVGDRGGGVGARNGPVSGGVQSERSDVQEGRTSV